MKSKTILSNYFQNLKIEREREKNRYNATCTWSLITWLGIGTFIKSGGVQLLPIILHGQLFRLIAWDPTTERAPRVHHIGSCMTAMRIASCEPSYTFQQYNVDITWQLKQLIENSTESHKTGDSILVYGTEMHEHWQR